MIYFVVGVCLLLGSSSSVWADWLQINAPGCGIPSRGMIVNGSAAKANQFPWMVHLTTVESNGEQYQCGGSILTKRHILTAAHCTYDDDGEPVERIYAHYGNTDWTRGNILSVTEMIPHPEYDDRKLYKDIAVLVVEKPFEYGSNARPICIPTAPMNILDTETIVAGWGYLKEGGKSTPELQYTTVRVLPNERCSAAYRWNYHSDVMYCAYEEGTDACDGDSGGPAMARVVGGRYVQVGIVSFGKGCARDDMPGVYARVEAFTPWLEQVVGSFDKDYSSQVALQMASYTLPQWPSIFQFF